MAGFPWDMRWVPGEARRRNLAEEAIWLGRLVASLLPDEPEVGLVLRRNAVLEPEQPERLEVLTQPGGFDRCQPVMHVGQQMKGETEFLA